MGALVQTVWPVACPLRTGQFGQLYWCGAWFNSSESLWRLDSDANRGEEGVFTLVFVAYCDGTIDDEDCDVEAEFNESKLLLALLLNCDGRKTPFLCGWS